MKREEGKSPFLKGCYAEFSGLPPIYRGWHRHTVVLVRLGQKGFLIPNILVLLF